MASGKVCLRVASGGYFLYDLAKLTNGVQLNFTELLAHHMAVHPDTSFHPSLVSRFSIKVSGVNFHFHSILVSLVLI